jgi:hypothetical protein
MLGRLSRLRCSTVMTVPVVQQYCHRTFAAAATRLTDQEKADALKKLSGASAAIPGSGLKWEKVYHKRYPCTRQSVGSPPARHVFNAGSFGEGCHTKNIPLYGLSNGLDLDVPDCRTSRGDAASSRVVQCLQHGRREAYHA